MLDPYQIRKDFPMLSRQVNGHPLVYLDSAATSQKPKAMIDRVYKMYSEEYAKVEEGHTLSKQATKAFEEVRAKTARLINGAPEELIFTRGCTEAINIVARLIEPTLKPGDQILVTAAEHHSNLIPW